MQNLYLREYADPESGRRQFAASDERLNRLFAAGRETFRQNALDIFMDCPSRERAGWLCDSFFTARVAQRPVPATPRVEQNFLENFLLPPEVRLPPGRHAADVLPGRPQRRQLHPQLGAVVRRPAGGVPGPQRRPRDGRRACGPRVLRLFDYFKQFRQRRRPAGEARRLGLRRVVRRQRLRPGRQLPQQHALRRAPSTPPARCTAYPS